MDLLGMGAMRTEAWAWGTNANGILYVKDKFRLDSNDRRPTT